MGTNTDIMAWRLQRRNARAASASRCSQNPVQLWSCMTSQFHRPDLRPQTPSSKPLRPDPASKMSASGQPLPQPVSCACGRTAEPHPGGAGVLVTSSPGASPAPPSRDVQGRSRLKPQSILSTAQRENAGPDSGGTPYSGPPSEKGGKAGPSDTYYTGGVGPEALPRFGGQMGGCRWGVPPEGTAVLQMGGHGCGLQEGGGGVTCPADLRREPKCAGRGYTR